MSAPVSEQAAAVQGSQQSRTKRLKDVQSEITRIAMLRKQIIEARELAREGSEAAATPA